jgi:hypothetical protein
MFASKDTLLTRPSGGYTIARSVRLRSSASGYFNRTPASASNRTTWTWSGWVKRGSAAFGTNGIGGAIFGGGSIATANQPNFQAQFYNDTIYLLETIQNVSGQLLWQSTAVYRDPSAWYHIVIAIDTTQATGTNRVKVYVNGVQATGTFTITPSQNQATSINNNVAQYQGAFPNNSQALFYMDGYMTEINFIDGQQLTPSSFGTTNAITGVWQPAKYTGTYGTNGFYLNFSDNSNNTATTIGKDYSGNGNNWTPNNISVTAGATYDSMTDVPTLTSATAANYCVMNPLWAGYGTPTFSNGNLQTVTSTVQTAVGSMALPNSAKTYFEATVTSETIANGTRVGIRLVTDNTQYGGWVAVGVGAIRLNDVAQQSSLATFTTGDVIGIAVDLTANTLQFYKNNNAFGTSNTITNSSLWVAQVQDNSGAGNTCTISWNFGQQPFVYTPPTGFKALNTYNLP